MNGQDPIELGSGVAAGVGRTRLNTTVEMLKGLHFQAFVTSPW